jgi:antitoxin component YwqK of YwqJK toxin-antitoxin module
MGSVSVVRELVKFKGLNIKKFPEGGQSNEEIWERVRHGESTEFYPNGQLSSSVTYDHGKLVSKLVFDWKGNPVLSEKK